MGGGRTPASTGLGRETSGAPLTTGPGRGAGAAPGSVGLGAPGVVSPVQPAARPTTGPLSFADVMRDNVVDPAFGPTIGEPRRQFFNADQMHAFTWDRPFQVGGQATFIPRAATPAETALRSRMLAVLGNSSFCQDLDTRLLAAARRAQAEHAAYIFDDGRLGQIFTSGESHGVADHAPETTVGLTGYVHSHPASTQIRPPSYPRDFLDSQALPVSQPTQLMIELAPGRVWGLIHPNVTFVLGLLTAGVFQPVIASAPQASQVWEMRR
jgi:hypothetical protein